MVDDSAVSPVVCVDAEKPVAPRKTLVLAFRGTLRGLLAALAVGR